MAFWVVFMLYVCCYCSLLKTHAMQKVTTLLLLVGLTFISSRPVPLKNTGDIIPQPVEMRAKDGTGFTITATTTINYPQATDWDLPTRYLRAMLTPALGVALPAQALPSDIGSGATFQRKNSIILLQDNAVQHAEGYLLDVEKDGIVIRARTAAGAFYAVQTLRQLLPANVSANKKLDVPCTAPACTIRDYPRFGYRGLHLDVGRHYFPVPAIKRYIDLLAAHKLNKFHWHLTEDQGWRIEIKQFPKLQTVAACRNETLIGHYSDQPERYTGTPYCHYYTQEEVKEVVEYARHRFVTVIPEIEMPGHALAALTAYPELGCTGGPYEVAKKWGVVDDVFCAGNEATFSFLDKVLTEVCALFPGQYVHVGGDECPKDRWKNCSKCQQRQKQLGLKDEHELQSYFIRRATEMLAKHNKKLIGWDEILEGGLAPSATVMSWRGTDGGIAAAKAGHDVIMTPGSHCYLDYYQSDPATEPLAIGGYLTLEKVYSYEPIPTELSATEAKHILGAQGNLWTEYISTPEKLDYMVYPRACALAEVVWSPADKRNWSNFSDRMKVHFPRLDAMGVNYAKSFYDVTSAYEKGKVQLTCADKTAQIHYTLDGSEPTTRSQRYTAPFALKSSSTVQTAAFVDGKQVSKVLKVKYLVHKASGKPYTLTKQPKQYQGGETYALTNGITGNISSWSTWVGLVNHDIDPVIDLGQPTDFNSVTVQYVNSPVAWIHAPRAVEVFVSRDAKTFRSIGKREVTAAERAQSGVGEVKFTKLGAKARYIKVVATSLGVIPDGQPGAREGAWLFLDEVVVE
jgi:hexosaminidase